MSRQDDIKSLIAQHSRRLYRLKEQQARMGLGTPPEILLEIEDIKNVISSLQTTLEADTPNKEVHSNKITVDSSPYELNIYGSVVGDTGEKNTIVRLIRIYQRRLQKLHERRALHGISVDPATILEIEEIEKEIQALMTQLEQLDQQQSQADRDANGPQIQGHVTVQLEPDTVKATGTVQDNFLKFKNPYTFGVPVRERDNFFGREPELRLIFDTLESVPRGQKQDLVVMGPRRIGKSSILLRLLDVYPPDFIPTYIDLQAIKPRDPYILFVTILRQIKRMFEQNALNDNLPAFELLTADSIPEKLQYMIFGDDIGAVNQAIAQAQLPRLMLMFDEIELLTEIGGVSALEWFRSLIQSLNYCVFIVAGSDLLYELTTDYTSPFYNIFKIIEVRALSEEAATALITTPAAKVGLTYPTSEIKRILHFTGGNPYFIQAMGHYLVEWLNQNERSQMQPADVDHVANQMIDNLSAQFNYFWSSFDAREQGLLYLMAHQQKSETVNTLAFKFLKLTNIRLSKQEQRELFANLSRQQAIRPVTEDGDSKYIFVVQLFADWIKAKIERDEIVDRIKRLEIVFQDSDAGQDQLGSLRNTRDIYRRNLNSLELELTKYGGDRVAPIHLRNQIEAAKSSIAELEEQIRRVETISG